MFSACCLLSFFCLVVYLHVGYTAPVKDIKDIEQCHDDYKGFKILRLVANSTNYDAVTSYVAQLQMEGKARILSTTGHKGFVLNYKMVILTRDEHLVDFLKSSPDEGDLVFINVPKKKENGNGNITLLDEYSDISKVEESIREQSGEAFGFTAYHTLESIYEHLGSLAELYPDKVEVIELNGTSHEGRKVKGVRITSNVTSAESNDKPLVFLEGGIHSREWIAPATLMYLIEALVGLQEELFATRTSMLIDQFQFVLIPVTNPDGYVYSRTDRMWRKTRKVSGCQYNLFDCNGNCYVKECYGADPNRNFDIDFGVMGSSTDPCDDSFKGGAPFDQVITVMLRDYFLKNKDKMVLYVGYHSYSQLFVYPWAHTEDKTVHFAHHQKVGNAFAHAVAQRHGAHYMHHPVSSIFQKQYPGSYEISGTSIDWVYRKLGLVDSYGIELRDQGENQFLLPTDQILPSGQENFDGLLALMDNLAVKGNKDIEQCLDDYKGFKILRLVANSTTYEAVTSYVAQLQMEGKARILSTTGFVFNYMMVVLTRDEHVEDFIKLNPEEGDVVFINVTKEKENITLFDKYFYVSEVEETIREQSEEAFGFTAYHTLESIYEHLGSLAELYPDKVEVIELNGTSHEGRKVKGVRITSNVTSAESNDKPLVFLEGGIHSREWIAPATLMYLIEALVGLQEEAFSAQTSVLIRQFQFVLIPVTNPDGYVYSRTDRMWRKTRKVSGCQYNLLDCNGNCYIKKCYGADPNRNWDIDFGVMGSSTDPCDESFKGGAPFDQAITAMLRDYFLKNKDKMVLYVGYHSYGQYFMYPWSHTEDKTVHFAHHQKVGNAFSHAVARRHGEDYIHHPVSSIFYEVSGTSMDWVYKKLGLIDSYGIELRDWGQNRFLLSTDQILPCGQENFDGMMALMDNLVYLKEN